MTLKEYMREIKLMRTQNFTEYDMYSVIAALMRDGENIKKLSLRDVNRRRGNTNKGRVFYGLSSIPDFAILDVDFENSDNWVNDIDKVYGCVEIKGFDTELLSIEKILRKINYGDVINIEEGQLLGEVLWYKKVLYTNGSVWKFLKWKKNESYWKNIKEFVKQRITKESGPETKEGELSEWYQDLSNKIDFKKIEIEEILYINLSENASDYEWNEFIKELYRIEWNN